MNAVGVFIIAFLFAVVVASLVAYQEKEHTQETDRVETELARVQSSLLEQQQVAQRLEDKLSNTYVYAAPYYASYYPTRFYAPYRNWRRWW